MRRPAVGIVACVLLAGCAVPRHKATAVADEPATSYGGAAAIVLHLDRVRHQADVARDPRRLADVEGGAALAADASRYRVAARLHQRRGAARAPWTTPTRLFVPRFTRYPLWFVATVEDSRQGTRIAAVFARASVTGPWQVVLAPRLTAGSRLPAVRTVRGGQVALAMTGRAGLARSPAAAVDRLCRVLGGARLRDAGAVSSDPVIRRMRRPQRRSGGRRVAERWARLPGGYALRAADGGALVFGAVRRQDRYRTAPGRGLRWARGSAAAAYQPGRVRRSATLTYAYQLLVYVPAVRGQEPRVLGAFGGLVGARSP